jgi:hypothetical protein
MIDEAGGDRRVKTLMLLLLHGERADRKFLNSALTDRDAPAVRRAAAYYISESKQGWEGGLGRLLDIFDSEDDAEALSYLLRVIEGYDEEELFEHSGKILKLEEISEDSSLPDSLRKRAGDLCTRHRRALDAHRAEQEQEEMEAREKAIRVNEGVRAEALEWKFDLGIGATPVARYDDGLWDGGLGLLLTSRVKKGLWLSEDNDRRLSMGIMPEINSAAMIGGSGIVLMPVTKMAIEWSGKFEGDKFSSIELAGGYAGRYEPLKATDEYENGWTVSAMYEAAEGVGLGLSFYHFPGVNDYIGGISVRGYFLRF